MEDFFNYDSLAEDFFLGLDLDFFELNESPVEKSLKESTFEIRKRPETVSTPEKEKQRENRNQCPRCDKICKNYKGFQQHMAKMHLGTDKQVKCEICDRSFRHKHALKFHILQVHEKATRVNCRKCGKSFYNKYVLKAHNCFQKIELR